MSRKKSASLKKHISLRLWDNKNMIIILVNSFYFEREIDSFETSYLIVTKISSLRMAHRVSIKCWLILKASVSFENCCLKLISIWKKRCNMIMLYLMDIAHAIEQIDSDFMPKNKSTSSSWLCYFQHLLLECYTFRTNHLYLTLATLLH